MRLLLLYGPHGVGKLSVAEEIARATNLRLFQNHLTVRIVAEVFGYGAPEFWRIVEAFTFDVIRSAVASKIDLILPFVYGCPGDDQLLERLFDVVEVEHGEVLLARLRCSREELLRRVASESRIPHGKIVDAQAVASLLDTYDLWAEIPKRASFTVDSTSLTPRSTANRVVKGLGL